MERAEKQYSVAQARDRLAALVHAAESEGPVRITRRGRPVAVLLSERDYERLSGGGRGFWEALQAFRGSVDAQALPEAGETFGDVRDGDSGRDVAL